MLKIKQLRISGINGIEDLNLKFNNGLNIICGENGIGKTTILDCIASSFNRHNRNVRRNVNASMGYWEVIGEVDDGERFYEEFYINEELDTNARKDRIKFSNRIRSKELVNFSINRTSQTNIYYGNRFDYIQAWMHENYYAENRLSSKKYNNLKLAQECFTRLDSRIKFSKVLEREIDRKYTRSRKFADIYLETPSGEIPFNFLSSGYRSCLLILLGVIQQTEITSGYKDAQQFDGTILIDELDLHLHPEWQAKLIVILKWLVPNAQIIATTHSPHIVQVAKQYEVIALSYLNKKNSEKIMPNYVSNEYGYQGWTIEEILRDVMDMESSYSKKFTNILSEFDESLTNLDMENTKYLFNKINNMLHPENHLRKILKIQITSLLEVDND